MIFAIKKVIPWLWWLWDTKLWSWIGIEVYWWFETLPDITDGNRVSYIESFAAGMSKKKKKKFADQNTYDIDIFHEDDFHDYVLRPTLTVFRYSLRDGNWWNVWFFFSQKNSEIKDSGIVFFIL